MYIYYTVSHILLFILQIKKKLFWNLDCDQDARHNNKNKYLIFNFLIKKNKHLIFNIIKMINIYV